ncbi:hypothetical protein HA402_001501 [Bradysia odoriphaga]|nr:hypothetical protein HA402_001501 [Bradysia odoriphaga]
MKRGAKDLLNGPPRKMSSMSTENFEFLELSICPTKVEVDENDLPSSTIDETTELPDFSMPVTMETFEQTLSRLGPCVKNVRIVSGNPVLLPCVEKHCKNVDRIELLEGEKSHALEHFRNLTEMKVPHVRIENACIRKVSHEQPGSRESGIRSLLVSRRYQGSVGIVSEIKELTPY